MHFAIEFSCFLAYFFFPSFLQSLYQNSRDILRGEVYDGGDEVVPDENGPDGPPFLGGLPNQQADALHGHLDVLGRIGKRPHLLQLLLLDGFHR